MVHCQRRLDARCLGRKIRLGKMRLKGYRPISLIDYSITCIHNHT
nr:MAG TPA: hypothetical protein [Bacteriophage sp.]